jgi:Flp pilus assembly protein TadG
MIGFFKNVGRRWGEFRRAEKGAVTIEFVVTFPLLLVVLALSFEFGRLFLAHHATVNNVREAVRYLSRSDLSAVQLAIADEIVRTGAAAGGAAPDWLADADIAITPSFSSFGSTNFRVSGQVVRVRATVDFPMLIMDFAADGVTTIPFIVVDDIPHFGD